MGHIDETKVLDFVIASDPMTDKDRQEIIIFIRNYINKSTAKKSKLAIASK